MSSDGSLIALFTAQICQMSLVKSAQQGILSSAQISAFISPDTSNISVARTQMACRGDDKIVIITLLLLITSAASLPELKSLVGVGVMV